MAALSCSLAGLAGCSPRAPDVVLPARLGPGVAPAPLAGRPSSPVVDALEVIGAEAAPDTLVARGFALAPAERVDATKLERGRIAAERAYAELGYPDTHIRVEVLPTTVDHARVIVRVIEGAPARIADVSFVGSGAAPADLARASGLVAGAVCSRALLEDAPRRLRFFFAERGHLDANAAVDPSAGCGHDAHLVVRVSDGAPHTVGRLDLRGIEPPPAGALRLREGAIFRPSDARADAETLAALAPRGTNVSHHAAIDRSARRVDVTFARAAPDIY